MYGTITHEAYPREDRLCNDARCVASILVCVAKALNPTKDPRAETFLISFHWGCDGLMEALVTLSLVHTIVFRWGASPGGVQS